MSFSDDQKTSASLRQPYPVSSFDNRLDHDVQFSTDHAPPHEQSVAHASTSIGGVGGFSGRENPRWRYLQVLAFAKLGLIEFVATYFFALCAIGTVVSSAMARGHVAETELSITRLATIVLGSTLTFATLHWGLNLFVEAQQALAPAEVVVHHGNEKRRPRAHNLRQSSPTMVILGSAPIAHMNPALTLALLIATDMHYIVAVLFLPAQLLAGALAATTVWAATPAEFVKHVTGVVASPESTWWQDLCCETIFTVFAFAAIVSYAATRGLSAGASDGVASGRGNTWEAYNDNDEDWMFVEDDEGDVLLQKEAPVGNGPSVLRRHTDKAAHYEDKVVRGLTSTAQVSLNFGPVFGPLFVATIVVTAVSGGSLNPALSFGLALVANKWKLHWLRWVAPIVGAVLLGFAVDGLQSCCGRRRHKKSAAARR